MPFFVIAKAPEITPPYDMVRPEETPSDVFADREINRFGFSVNVLLAFKIPPHRRIS